jgi:phage terminase large subunit
MITDRALLLEWADHPARMVRELFGVEPDPPQEEALERFPHCKRIALKACTGSGKTAVLAWIGWNFLLTRPEPMCGATSVSGDNLKAGLWTELARWRAKSPLLTQYFEQTKTVIFHKSFPSTWKLEARTWAKDADASMIGNALRGVHSDYVLWLLDETGDYPDSVLPIVEAIFSGDPKEAHIIQAGNPIKVSGPLYRACTRGRDLWHVIEITADPDDPRRTARVSAAHAREQIALYGRDNPWVVVNIFGRFPPSSINALIGPDEVGAAMKRYYRAHEIAGPRIMGVDVAREGDDKSALARRHGLQMFPFTVWRNLDGPQGAGQVSRIWRDWEADACFVDATGGWGWTWIDQLRQLGRAPLPVQFAAEPHDKARYFNKRTEMYFDLVQWIKSGGALPQSPELLRALTETTYSFKGDRLLLEDKTQIKQRLLASPDEADAAAMTFAEPVMAASARAGHLGTRAPSAVDANYDPFAEIDRRRYIAGRDSQGW